MARTTYLRRLIATGISLLLALIVLLPQPAAAVIVLPLSEPVWADLTPRQREILQPLANEWDDLDGFRRKKWLGIAQRYPGMGFDEQQRVQRRMKDWVKLSPTERKQVRERYKDLQKAPPEQRAVVKQKWQEYKDLPDTEKERLRQQARTQAQTRNPLQSKSATAG